MPTFSFPETPQYLTILLLRRWNAPLPIFLFHSFGNMLNARLSSTLDRSTSELLRTL
jgi:hypothetical protein